MDYQIQEKKKSIKKVLLVLTIISFALSVLGNLCILYFQINYMNSIEDPRIFAMVYGNEVTFWIKWVVTVLISYLLPFFMALYISQFYGTEKGRKILPFLFVAFMVNILWGYLGSYILNNSILLADDFNIYLCLDFSAFVMFLLAMIFAFKGKLKRIFVIIGVAVFLTAWTLDVYFFLRNFWAYIYGQSLMSKLYFLSGLFNFVSSLIWYIALLIFGIKGEYPNPKLDKDPDDEYYKESQDIPEDSYYAPAQEEYQGYQEYHSYEYSEPQVAYEPTPEPPRAQELTSEQKLIFLREQYKSGIISEEEYLSKMTEVVKTL